MKKFLVLMTLVFCISTSFLSYAGEWKQDTAGWQYVDDNGILLKDTFFKDPSSGLIYFIDSNGYMQTGIVNIDEKDYYFTETGALGKNSITPDGRPTDANGVVFAGFNNGITVMIAAASDTQAGIGKLVVVAYKNECDKTFTIKSNLELTRSGEEKTLYLYDVETKKFYDEKIIKPNETVTLSFAASDLSEFKVDDNNFVQSHVEFNHLPYSAETRIQTACRVNWPY